MKLLLLVWAVAAGACTTATTTPPSFPRKTNLGLRILPGKLSNGLRVMLVTDPNAAEVQVTTRYQVGSKDDPEGQEGIAHLVEHMMFQPVLGSQSVFAKLQDVTTSYGGTTSFDATTYTSRANPARLAELLSVEAVRLGFRCATVSESVFERERQVVVNEHALRDASWEIWMALHRALYPDGHPYRRRATAQSVAAITREQACAFAEAHYAPSNAVIVISGPVKFDEVENALDRFVAKVPAREVAPGTTVAAVPAKARRVDAQAPLDDKAILVAWPMPVDPVAQLAIKTTATMVDISVSSRGLGVTTVWLGDSAAPMFGFFIEVDEDDERTTEKILSEIEAAVTAAPPLYRFKKPEWLAQALVDKLKQSAIYSAFSSLEDGSGRDQMIATLVLAGRDPNAMLTEQGRVLNTMTAEELERLAQTHLRFDQATVAVLTPSEAKKGGADVKPAAPVHDVGQRRDPGDPADAMRPADENLPAPRATMRKRTLPNGLDVVLLPAASVPTVEVRLVFQSGSADDDAASRGASRAAAHALQWSSGSFQERILFSAGGGSFDVDVDLDHTSFTARGLDMHLDLLLVGVQSFVRDGVYDVANIAALRKAARTGTSERAILDAWRTALFGASHPYAHASDVSPTLTLAAVEEYRQRHYTPGNATLVIAGRFDADLAEKWIDHLFADWSGDAPKSPAVYTASEPVSIANDADTTQVAVAIAMPAGRGNRAEQLVAAAMLDVIVEDIRHQLGASYSFNAGLDEARLAQTYVAGGWIDAPRVRDAFELVRLRLGALRSDPEAAARTFITARRRVLTRLLASTSSASELAGRVQRDVALDRAPLSDAQTADAVNKLTIDKLAGALEELDLSRAVVVLRGPQATLDDAFAALGRTPKRLAATLDDEEPETAPSAADVWSAEANVDAEDPSKPSGTRWTVDAFAGYSIATVVDRSVEGFTYGADLGYRFKRSLAAGAQVSYTSVDGEAVPESLADPPVKIDASALRVMGFAQVSGADDRLWAAGFAGLSLVNAKDNQVKSSSTGFGVGLQGGYDVANFGTHHVTVYGRFDYELASSSSYAAFSFGFGYRYR